MARTTARIDRRKRRIRRRKFPCLGVETKNEHFVEPKIRDDGIPIVRRNHDRMRMGFELNLWIYAAANVLNEKGQLAQRTVFPDPNHRDAPAAEVRHHYVFTGLIHRDEAGTGAAGRSSIEQMQFSAQGVNRKS